MDSAALPYLKKIADALKGLKSIGALGGGSTVSGTISLSGLNLSGIADKLEAGLLATVTEEEGGEEVEVIKSVIDVLRDALNDTLHKANFITVEEEGQGGQTVEVEKSVFEVIKDDIAAL